MMRRKDKKKKKKVNKKGKTIDRKKSDLIIQIPNLNDVKK